MGLLELRCSMEGTTTVELDPEYIARSTFDGVEIMKVEDCEDEDKESPMIFRHWSQAS